MFYTKSILTKICNKGESVRELSDIELRSLQQHLVKMYRDIETLCKKHNIEICLAFGNVLGAVRHNGWIPWDDDLDIHMKREDYDKFLMIVSKELPQQYIVSSYLTSDGSYARFAKIFDRCTIFVPLTEERNDETGCFIDIFPIDNVPNQPIRNRIRRTISFFLMYTAGSVMQYQKNSKRYKDLMSQSQTGKINWCIRHIWGRLFSFLSYKKWNELIEKYGKNAKESGYIHVMAELKSCYKQIDKDMILPFKSITLPEIGTVNIPNSPDKYLSYFYGDWRSIPNNEEKWHHYVSDFKIP